MIRTILLTTTTILPSLAQTGGNLSNCKSGCQLGELCVGNPFSQPVSDDECLTCAGGRYWWPCNFETLCYCNSVEEGSPRVPPAPKSGLKVNEDLNICSDILTQDVFNALVQPTSDEARALYSYDGLCNAINQYNEYHAEKFANMGTEEQMRAELAAFLAHTYVDTNGYSVTREDMHCVNPITGSDGKTYCKPCKEEHYDAQTKTCSQSYFNSANSYKEYCDVTRQPPQGCACTNESVLPTTVVPGFDDASIDTTGYMAASDAYFVRGSIPISWNYDYYGASQSLTGNPDLLCNNPDLVATNPQLAWGVGIYKWMEKMTFGTTGSTAHKQALKGNFGGTIEVLYGELECPASEWSSASHVDMVQERVAQICKTGSVLGVYLEMDKCGIPSDCLQCQGLREIYDSCTEESCEACPTWTEYIRSSAPTVTPIRVSSPTFEDWDYRPRSSAVESVSSPYWGVVSSLVCLIVISGSWSLIAVV